MNNFVFYSPTEFVFGKDAEAQVGTMVRMYGGSCVFNSHCRNHLFLIVC